MALERDHPHAADQHAPPRPVGRPDDVSRTTRSAGRGPATRRSSGPSRSRRTTAGRPTASSSTGRRGSRRAAASGRSSRTSPTSRRRCSRRRACRSRRSVNGTVQRPFDGTSMAYTFDDPAAPETHTTQYFEMFGNRGIYHDGWVAATRHSIPWLMVPLPPLTAGRLGAVRHRPSTSARRTTWRRRIRRSSRRCRTSSSKEADREPRAADRRPPVRAVRRRRSRGDPT